MAMNRSVKRALAGIIAVIGIGLVIAFVLSHAWFGVAFGGFIAILGITAFMSPDDVFRAEAKELPTRGAPPPSDSTE